MNILAEKPADCRIPSEMARILVDPAAYADQRLHETYTWLRAHNPLGYAEAEGYEPFWVATRHADVLEVSRRNDIFGASLKPVILTTIAADQMVRSATGGDPNIIRSLVSMDGAEHMKYRGLTQAWFLPRNIARLEARIRAIARGAVDRMLATGGECDFVRDIAMGYPLHVVMDILGVPEDDEPRMLMLTQQLFGPQDPDAGRSVGEADDPARFAHQVAAIFADFNDYFSRLSADRRANPRDDLATLIANATIDGEPLPAREAMSYYIIVATAGHDTTSSSTAGAMWALAERPALYARVREDATLLPGMVEEAVRWTTPVKHFLRCATADTELAGRRIAAGELVMLCYASANRDEAVFEDPFDFRVDRPAGRHLAFGHGAHVCLGQHLARMEMRILFEELLPRVRAVELAGTPRNMQSCFVSGPKSLPLRFIAA